VELVKPTRPRTVTVVTLFAEHLHELRPFNAQAANTGEYADAIAARDTGVRNCLVCRLEAEQGQPREKPPMP
jgi:hypothetical protein